MVDPVTVHDGPDPADNGPAEEELEKSEDECVHAESLFADEGGDNGSPTWAEDVHDEQDDVDGWVNCGNSCFARSCSFSGVGLRHI